MFRFSLQWIWKTGFFNTADYLIQVVFSMSSTVHLYIVGGLQINKLYMYVP